MQISLLFGLASLLTSAHSAIVYNTVYTTAIVVVTADANGNVQTPAATPVVTSTSEAPAPVQTSPEASVEVTTVTVDAPSNDDSAPSPSSSSPAAEPASPSPSPSADNSESNAVGASSSSSSDLARDMVNYHNEVRKQHSVGSVTWNDTLAQFAQHYVDNNNCVFAHSGGPYGENIALGYSSSLAAAKAWYDENTQYDYSSGQFGTNTGHFTQMVWKGTHQIGCATHSCPQGSYLACEYYPRGNIIGQFKENVF